MATSQSDVRIIPLLQAIAALGFCIVSADNAMSQVPTNSPYPINDIPVTLSTGTIVRVRNVVILDSPSNKSLTLYVQTPTPQSDSSRVAGEVAELASRWSEFIKNHDVATVIVGVCRTQACLETREIPAEMFRVGKESDGTWRAKPLDG